MPSESWRLTPRHLRPQPPAPHPDSAPLPITSHKMPCNSELGCASELQNRWRSSYAGSRTVYKQGRTPSGRCRATHVMPYPTIVCLRGQAHRDLVMEQQSQPPSCLPACLPGPESWSENSDLCACASVRLCVCGYRCALPCIGALLVECSQELPGTAVVPLQGGAPIPQGAKLRLRCTARQSSRPRHLPASSRPRHLPASSRPRHLPASSRPRHLPLPLSDSCSPPSWKSGSAPRFGPLGRPPPSSAAHATA
jgi:hypothetical protein